VSSYVTDGSALERARPFSFRARSAVRGAALSVLSRVPRTPGPGVRIVHYHYVFDDERERFGQQLQFLAREFTPVSLTDAVERLQLGRSEGDEIVVTFDDGFQNQLDNAAPLLAEHGFSACFFLVTDLLDASPDRARRIERERLHLPLPVEPLDWEGAERLLALDTRSARTRSRTRTSRPSRPRSSGASWRPRARSSRGASEQCGTSVRPTGERGRFSERVAAAARDAGYDSCATAMRGRNTSALDLYALRRDHLSARWPMREVEYFLT
jgi:peptidoglycan/xylan/chitin deacetylase (PgdA/CDA1 family)